MTDKTVCDGCGKELSFKGATFEISLGSFSYPHLDACSWECVGKIAEKKPNIGTKKKGKKK